MYIALKNIAKPLDRFAPLCYYVLAEPREVGDSSKAEPSDGRETGRRKAERETAERCASGSEGLLSTPQINKGQAQEGMARLPARERTSRKGRTRSLGPRNNRDGQSDLVNSNVSAAKGKGPRNHPQPDGEIRHPRGKAKAQKAKGQFAGQAPDGGSQRKPSGPKGERPRPLREPRGQYPKERLDGCNVTNCAQRGNPKSNAERLLAGS